MLIVKISLQLEISLYSENFVFRYIAKILFVAKFSALAVLCINDHVLVNFISTLVIAFVLVCFCNFPCSEHYISSVKFL